MEFLLPNQPRRGLISEFGGYSKDHSRKGELVGDPGMTPTEGLALFEPSQVSGAVDPYGISLFKLEQPDPGLGRDLNAEAMYCACRWNYKETPKDVLRRSYVLICSLNSIFQRVLCVRARPVDWGPNAEMEETKERVVDASPGVLHYLKIKTDDLVEVTLIITPS